MRDGRGAGMYLDEKKWGQVQTLLHAAPAGNLCLGCVPTKANESMAIVRVYLPTPKLECVLACLLFLCGAVICFKMKIWLGHSGVLGHSGCRADATPDLLCSFYR